MRSGLPTQASHPPANSDFLFLTMFIGAEHHPSTIPLAQGGWQGPKEAVDSLTGMPIQDEDIIDVTPKRLNTAERLFLPSIFKGLGTTMRHAFQNFGRNGKNKNTLWVVQYPEEKRDDRPVVDGGQYRDYFRGVHRLNKDEDDRVRCVACFMCATACPANCIHIVAEESPWEDREKYPKQFDIDELRCIYCGMCEEACPCDAIELTPHYEITGMSRQELIFDKTKLLEVYDQTVDEKPM